MGVCWDSLWETWLLRRTWRKCLVFALGFALLMVVVRAQFTAVETDSKLTLRNFYGVLSIEEDNEDIPECHIRKLFNGRILHGAQFTDMIMSKMPTTYYDSESGIGLTLLNYRRDAPIRVAIVGLGTGTLAAYGGQGDVFCFYELNPNSRHIALNHFSYIRDSGADVRILMGDARLTLERQEPQAYDVIALDAFSGDAIPAHLLTLEAFEQYARHLLPEGVIAVHISNRHLDLLPVVGGIAERLGIPAHLVESIDDGLPGDASSDWVLLTHNEEFLAHEAITEVAEDIAGTYTPVPLWTDRYSNLFQILAWE
jgi:hypothetical protein